MITQEQINDFFAQTHFAIIGVSRNNKKHSYVAYYELKQKGFDIVPVNPNTDTIEGNKCYKCVEDLPNTITAAIVFTAPKYTLKAVEQLVQKGITHLWVQQMCDTPEVIEYAKGKDINLIYGTCIFMFSKPIAGIHKFHRCLMKIFKRLPK